MVSIEQNVFEWSNLIGQFSDTERVSNNEGAIRTVANLFGSTRFLDSFLHTVQQHWHFTTRIARIDKTSLAPKQHQYPNQ